MSRTAGRASVRRFVERLACASNRDSWLLRPSQHQTLRQRPRRLDELVVSEPVVGAFLVGEVLGPAIRQHKLGFVRLEAAPETTTSPWAGPFGRPTSAPTHAKGATDQTAEKKASRSVLVLERLCLLLAEMDP